jgi:hypothetical protein
MTKRPTPWRRDKMRRRRKKKKKRQRPCSRLGV